MSAPQFIVREVRLYEREVRLRMPFRFGVVTLTQAPQCFVRVRIETPDGASHWGAAAELLAPKWFDKNLALSNEDNFDQLRRALKLAADAYQDGKPRSAFAHFAAHYEEQIAAGATHGLNALVSNFGPAQIDCAILDALCLSAGVSFYEGISRNIAGIDPALFGGKLSDLAGFDMNGFLAGLKPAKTIAARHTVGLVDVIGGHPAQVNDGLPESLEEVVATYGHRFFKLKVGGNLDADLARLTEIAAVLDTIDAPYSVSLDGNEQYNDIAALLELWRRMQGAPQLKRLVDGILFIEQPITRAHALDGDVSALSTAKPVIIDESDDDLSVFPRARATWLCRRVEQMLQGAVQITSQCRALRYVERARKQQALFHDRRGSDDAGRISGAAGSGAGQSDRPDACRAQRPSLRQWHGRTAGARTDSVSGIPCRAL